LSIKRRESFAAFVTVTAVDASGRSSAPQPSEALDWLAEVERFGPVVNAQLSDRDVALVDTPQGLLTQCARLQEIWSADPMGALSVRLRPVDTIQSRPEERA